MNAACARAVHTLFDTACEICNLCVLAAKLYSYVCLRNKCLYCRCSCGNLLYKGYSEPVRYRDTARACYRNGHILLVYGFKASAENLCNCLFYIRIMPLIILVYGIISIVQHRNFNGS